MTSRDFSKRVPLASSKMPLSNVTNCAVIWNASLSSWMSETWPTPMSALVRLPQRAVLLIGIAIVAGHNLLDPVVPERFGGFSLLWTFLHEGGLIQPGSSPVFNFAYPILPWAGVMALGFGLGPVFLSPDGGRMIRKLGIAMLAAFLLT